MSKKVTAVLKQGQTLGFDVEGVGGFQWQCGACEFPYFILSDNKTTVRCGHCGVINAKLEMSVSSDLSGIEWKL